MKKLLSTATLCVSILLSCLAPVGQQAIAATADIEAGFSPGGTAEALVLKSIGSARRTVRMAAYSFTAPTVVRSLIDAKKRGVDVAVLVDFKHNIQTDKSRKAVAALNLLVNAGITTRTVSTFAIQHSKYIVIDGTHVQSGSYNYSAAATRSNSENVLVLWDRPVLAQSYLENWKYLYDQSEAFHSTY